MDHKPWSEMDYREKDALVSVYLFSQAEPTEELLHYQRGAAPFYTANLISVRLVEDEIERRGLQDRYSEILAQITGKPSEIGRFDERYKDAWRVDWWGLIRATPEQRCLAALRAVGVEI